MKSDFVQCASGDGKYRIAAQALRCGSDWCVTVCGGEAPHIGAVSLGQYEPVRDSATVSTIAVFTHRDDAIASRFAKQLAAKAKCTVTVSAGIHVDGAGEADLLILRENCEDCLRALLQEMEERPCD